MKNVALVGALRDIERTFEPSAWEQPEEAASHRQLLTELIDGDTLVYPRAFSYRTSRVAAYLSALDRARELAAEVADPELRSMVRAHIEEQRTFEIARASGDESYRRSSIRRHGLPDAAVLAESRRILAEPQPAEPSNSAAVSAAELRSMIELALRNYDLESWTVELHDNMAARVSVNASLRRLRIRSRTTFDAVGARRLVVHEVGGHVLRAANSGEQSEQLAVLPLGRAVATEEGHALWLEERHGLLEQAQLRVYSARALAVSMAAEHGILEVGRALLPLVGRHDAVEIALRVKRGLRDPNRPGGLTKDYGYLAGLMSIRSLSVAPGTLSALAVTKWSADFLPVAARLLAEGSLRPASRLPDAKLLGIVEPPATASAPTS